MSNLLVKCRKDGSDFSFFGNFTTETEKDLITDKEGNRIWIHYPYCEFSDITVTQVVNGEEIIYEPKGYRWNGTKYCAESMLEYLIAALIRKDSTFEVCDLNKELGAVVEWYHKPENIVFDCNGNPVPRLILGNDLYLSFELSLVTDKYIYYLRDDLALMLSTETHEIISDNYFADVGFWESVASIRKKDGNETLLWGTIPEDD